MTNSIHRYFSRAYAKGDSTHKYGAEDLIVRASERFKPGSSVLDLGSGAGEGSLYLAERNFKVTAVEYAESGIKRMMELAKKKNVKIKSFLGDVTDPKVLAQLGSFDNIISINLLQFLLYTQIDFLISWMQSHTNPGGYNVISAFVARNEKEKQGIIKDSLKENRPHLIRYLFSQNELNERYASWGPDYHKEFLGPWESHGENRHRHYLGHLIAQKI